MRRIVSLVSCIAVELVAAVHTMPASASVGAGVGAAPIQLAQPVHPGTTSTLPAVYVVNTGTEASVFVIQVLRIAAGRQRAVPASWLQFGANDFTLPGGASRYVPITLTIPASAPTGGYLTDVVVATHGPITRGGIAVGARAATRLQFTVTAPSVTSDPPISIPGWAIYVLMVVVGSTLSLGMLRWSGISVQVHRRR